MRAHTVILGAGATVATIPNGDKHGKKSSVMNGLIEKLHLSDVLSGVQLKTNSDNLEDIYSELYKRTDCKKELKELEKEWSGLDFERMQCLVHASKDVGIEVRNQS